jgi:hypothetical protein
MRKTGECCLCGGKYHLYGNNPWPLSDDDDDRCCGQCDREYVIPARVELIRAEEDKTTN